MLFDLRVLQFTFRAEQPVLFGASAANVFRGALGTELKKTAGDNLYSRLFEPRKRGRSGGPFVDKLESALPSGFTDLPRPFVLRARHLDNQAIPEGSEFSVAAHLFDLDHDVLAAFRSAFEQFSNAGLGHTRSLVRLLSQTDQLQSIDLNQGGPPLQAIRVHLLTTTELKGNHDWSQNPDFATLACRIRDRITTLRQLYGTGPLTLDFRRFAERATHITTLRSQLQRTEVHRRSSRSGQSHSLGGVLGEIDYAGDLAAFLPYLEAAHWTGVGRQTVWGKGELLFQPLAS